MTRSLRILAVLFTLSSPAGAWEDPPDTIAGPVEASVIKVRDGDTVEVEAYIWPMQAVRIAVRLRGVDAPEIRGKCEAEKAAAEDARARLTDLVGDGHVQLKAIQGDKYFGRVLAQLSTDAEPDIGARLLREGLVGGYDGGKRRDWCAAIGMNNSFALPLGRG